MKARIRWFAVFFLMTFAMTINCAADYIYSYDLAWQSGKHENITACNVSLYVLEAGLQSSSILGQVIDPSSTGMTFTATASDPGFSNFVNYITNASNGWVVVSLQSISGQSTFTDASQESALFNKSGPTIFDIQGSNVTSVSLTVNTFILDSPGGNPWHDGTNTDITSDFTISVHTVPEPNTFMIVGVFAGAAIIFRRKMFFR